MRKLKMNFFPQKTYPATMWKMNHKGEKTFVARPLGGDNGSPDLA